MTDRTDIEVTLQDVVRRLRCEHVLVTMLFNERQLVLAHSGRVPVEDRLRDLSIEHSLCHKAATQGRPLIVPDVRKDSTLTYSPELADLGIRAYAGVPIYVGVETGAVLCATDSNARRWPAEDQTILREAALDVASNLLLPPYPRSVASLPVGPATRH